MTRILLISVGATPQVVTETLFALVVSANPWWPDQLVLVTTTFGEALFKEGGGPRNLAPLLGETGKLLQLAMALGRPVPEVKVEVPSINGIGPLADIRSDAETQAFADCLLTVVRGCTQDPAIELHVSLAGGRKTMSALVCQVLSLLGRPQDRLSHVLIEPPALESEPEFWWPEQGEHRFPGAIVRLHDLPFLRVGAWIEPSRLFPADATFQTAVELANAALSVDAIHIDLARCILVTAGRELRPSTSQLSALALAAITSRRGEALSVVQISDVSRPSDGGSRAIALNGDLQRATRLWAWLRAASLMDDIYKGKELVSFHAFDQRVGGLTAGFVYDIDLGQPLSRLRKLFRDKLPDGLAQRLLPKPSLNIYLPASGITFRGPPELASHPDAPRELYD